MFVITTSDVCISAAVAATIEAIIPPTIATAITACIHHATVAAKSHGCCVLLHLALPVCS